jgi:hypothetical protein
MLTDERGKTQHPMDNYELNLFVDALKRLHVLAVRLHRRYIWLCDNQSRGIDDDGNDLIVAHLQDEADATAHNVGLYTYHQTDCRGASLYVSFFPIPENDYTHAACVGF